MLEFNKGKKNPVNLQVNLQNAKGWKDEKHSFMKQIFIEHCYHAVGAMSGDGVTVNVTINNSLIKIVPHRNKY